MRWKTTWRGAVGIRRFVAHTKPSKKLKKRCNKCNRVVRRSWRTGVLHPNCYVCRKLIMVYGPNIHVTVVE